MTKDQTVTQFIEDAGLNSNEILEIGTNDAEIPMLHYYFLSSRFTLHPYSHLPPTYDLSNLDKRD